MLEDPMRTAEDNSSPTHRKDDPANGKTIISFHPSSRSSNPSILESWHCGGVTHSWIVILPKTIGLIAGVIVVNCVLFTHLHFLELFLSMILQNG
ncbi:hypothetical protein TNIN_467191 [Trichonephila inaurata madagascariensis]|uniref:Uncharacterized protein n=1 Tax=Trichonephila inaurata madagascariensis TaxID=2747483 RepID=A0A8X6M8P0_9ARAC|nr:hypothetical protein TNIN_467191 [Trichonephila inaurata madagascariensis]